MDYTLVLNIANWKKYLALLVLLSVTCKGIQYGDACDKDSDCPDMMRCHLNLCSCKPEYNTLQTYAEHDEYINSICISKSPCVGMEYYDVSLWCRGSPLDLGKCINGTCHCPGHLMRSKINMFEPENSSWSFNFDWTSNCIYAYNGIKRYCSDFSLCDVSVGLICTVDGCLCNRDMIYDFTAKKCSTRATYIKEYNLTEYKVGYGLYCNKDDDCINETECYQNHTCICSDPSYIYDKNTNSCHYSLGLPIQTNVTQIVFLTLLCIVIITGLIYSVITTCVKIGCIRLRRLLEDHDERALAHDFDDIQGTTTTTTTTTTTSAVPVQPDMTSTAPTVSPPTEMAGTLNDLATAPSSEGSVNYRQDGHSDIPLEHLDHSPHDMGYMKSL